MPARVPLGLRLALVTPSSTVGPTASTGSGVPLKTKAAVSPLPHSPRASPPGQSKMGVSSGSQPRSRMNPYCAKLKKVMESPTISLPKVPASPAAGTRQCLLLVWVTCSDVSPFCFKCGGYYLYGYSQARAESPVLAGTVCISPTTERSRLAASGWLTSTVLPDDAQAKAIIRAARSLPRVGRAWVPHASPRRRASP